MSSYNFVAVLAAVCGLSGVQTILTTFLKRAVAYPDKFVVTNPFGLKKEIPWNAVTEVKTVPLSLRVTFITRNDSVSVNGRGKEYGEFIRAREKIRPLLEVMCWDGYINGIINRESSDENRYVPVQPMILLSNGKTEREFGENTLF